MEKGEKSPVGHVDKLKSLGMDHFLTRLFGGATISSAAVWPKKVHAPVAQVDRAAVS